MKQFFIFAFFLLFVQFSSFAQLDYGKVKSDNHLCVKKKQKCKCDSVKLVFHICNSENEMEIRLLYIDAEYTTHFYTLSYDSTGHWAASLELDSVAVVNGIVRSGINKVMYSLEPKTSYDSIFNELKTNKVFRLPGINKGTGAFSITYKAGNKRREYYFSDPSNRMANELIEIRRYGNIVAVFQNEFSIVKEEKVHL